MEEEQTDKCENNQLWEWNERKQMEHSIVHDSMNVHPIQMKIMSKCGQKREEQSFGSIGEFWMCVEEKNSVKTSSKSLLWKSEWQQWAVIQMAKCVDIKCCSHHLSLQCLGISSLAVSRMLFHLVVTQSCGVSTTNPHNEMNWTTEIKRTSVFLLFSSSQLSLCWLTLMWYQDS